METIHHQSTSRGLSALEAARRHGKNVISGHTHRAGRSAPSQRPLEGVYGRVLHGVEVGNLMDFRTSLHIPKGVANWQQAFASIYVTQSARFTLI